ncbi:MAG TPA: tetratricopeptide repeat protein [Candidatus Synoicihabitans sp.]|nr:tetratricopeptide repeat protein [Candidatus Synoicihabitans sp.]
MSAHLVRAQLLLEQSRPVDAEREATHALAQDPHNAQGHALLALSRLAQRRAAEALPEAQTAVGLEPDTAFYHRVLGTVWHQLDRRDEALKAAREAIRLDPSDPDSYVLQSSVQLSRRDWAGALTSAESALALAPEHVDAANFRSMALVHLGRKAEAMATVDYALGREPDNALSHANQGWNCLHANEPRRAQEHFREALRLNPELEYAREGMLEALKARNPIYRGMLAYYLWIGRQSGRLQIAFIAGIFFGNRLLDGFAAAQPQFAWLTTPLRLLFFGFIYLTWTAGPMFNLLLRIDRFGRHVLSREQRTGSTWFGLAFAAMLGALAWWLIGDSDAGMLLTVHLAIISICVAATVSRTGRSRLLLAVGTVAIAVLALASFALIAAGHRSGVELNRLVIYAFIAFQIGAMLQR